MEQAELRLKDKVFSLFEPDALLPVQYFETLRRKVPIERSEERRVGKECRL